jgi:hypothetical protein
VAHTLRPAAGTRCGLPPEEGRSWSAPPLSEWSSGSQEPGSGPAVTYQSKKGSTWRIRL